LEYATATGNSPRVSAGVPSIVKFVGSRLSMANADTVLSPGFTAKSNYCQ
jgi:hypothetical protein